MARVSWSVGRSSACAAIALSGLLLGGLSACSGSSSSQVANPAGTVAAVADPSLDQTSAPLPTTADASAPTPAAVINVTGRADDGTTESVELDLWDVERASNVVVWQGWAAPSACQIDPQRDALVPGLAILTNTSTGFDTKVVFGLNQFSPVGPPTLLSEENFSSGPACGGGVDSSDDHLPVIFLASNNSLSPGLSIGWNFYIVVPDYYSPGHPNGDPSYLGSFTLSALLSSTTTRFNEMKISGPGALQDLGTGLLTLNGIQPQGG